PKRPGQGQTGVDMTGSPPTGHGHAHVQRPLFALDRGSAASPVRRRVRRVVRSFARSGARGVARPRDSGRLPVVAVTSARPIDNSTPTAPSDTTSDDPPNEMNGRGTPVMGRTPVAPPRL